MRNIIIFIFSRLIQHQHEIIFSFNTPYCFFSNNNNNNDDDSDDDNNINDNKSWNIKGKCEILLLFL